MKKKKQMSDEDKKLTAQDEMLFCMSIKKVDKDGNVKRVPPEEWDEVLKEEE